MYFLYKSVSGNLSDECSLKISTYNCNLISMEKMFEEIMIIRSTIILVDQIIISCVRHLFLSMKCYSISCPTRIILKNVFFQPFSFMLWFYIPLKFLFVCSFVRLTALFYQSSIFSIYTFRFNFFVMF